MKKLLSIFVTAIIAMSIMSIGVCASEPLDEIKFEVVDENGNVVEVLDMIYIEEVAEMYEQYLKQRASTVFHDLSSSSYNMSGGSASMVMSSKYFRANSSGRIYYDCETTGVGGNINVYENAGGGYLGSFMLQDYGSNIYGRNGRFTGLDTSTDYVIGILSSGGNFSSYYATFSWSEL